MRWLKVVSFAVLVAIRCGAAWSTAGESGPEERAAAARSQDNIIGDQQRAAQQQPIVLNVLPTQKTPEESAEEKRQSQEKAELDRRLVEWTAELARFTAGLFMATIFLFIATGVLGYFAYRQSRDTKESIRIANRTADLTERNLVATQRAFVHLKAIVATPIRDPNGVLRALMISPEWENSGTTPTRDLSINVNWTPYAVGDPPPGLVHSFGEPPIRLFLGPKAVSFSGSVSIPPSEYENAKRGAARLFVWGRSEYSDVFEGTNPHFTQFCFQIDIRSIPGASDWIGFVHFGDYNRSDEDT
jgi:hypothetical protein